MYGLTSIISFLIRQFLLPNPFVNMFENAEVVNLIFGGVFIPLAYVLTGTWYRSQKGFYWIGSLGFLGNYTLLTFLLIGISYFISNIYWIIAIFLIIYVLLCILESKIFGEKYSF